MSSIIQQTQQHPARAHVTTLGQAGHGKTTLLSALTRVLARASAENTYIPVAQLENISDERVRGVTIAHTEVTYTLGERQYIHVDYPGTSDCLKGLIAGLYPLDGGILVISASDGPGPQTREQVALARQLNLPALLVFLNVFDQEEEEELLEVVELEVRELLARFHFTSVDTPIIRGSALQALESTGDLSRSDPATQGIWTLLEEMQARVQVPLPPQDRPFLMAIENIFAFKGRDLAVVGSIERGKVNVRDMVEVSGLEKESSMAYVTGLEILKKNVRQASAGSLVACFYKRHRTHTDEPWSGAGPARIGRTPYHLLGSHLHPLTRGGRPPCPLFSMATAPNFIYGQRILRGKSRCLTEEKESCPGTTLTSMCTFSCRWSWKKGRDLPCARVGEW